eukprot:51619-Eustigmatos_ZCMA.PRE.1
MDTHTHLRPVLIDPLHDDTDEEAHGVVVLELLVLRDRFGVRHAKRGGPGEVDAIGQQLGVL